MAFLIQTVLHSDSLSFTVSTTLDMPESRGLTMLKVAALASERKAGVITRKDGWLSPAAQAIVAELKAHLRAGADQLRRSSTAAAAWYHINSSYRKLHPYYL